MMGAKTILTILCTCLWVGASFSQNWQGIGLPWQSEIYTFLEDTSGTVLYIGGRMPGFGGPNAKGVTEYDGQSLTFYDKTIHPVYSYAYYQGDLIVAGGGGVRKWTGSEYEHLGGGIIDQTLSLRVHEDKLYAFGRFKKADTLDVEGMAVWDGQVWSRIDNYPAENGIYSMNNLSCGIFYKDHLYIGGLIADSKGLAGLVRGDGEKFELVGNGLRGIVSQVVDMLIWHDTLYVAGTFYRYNGNPGSSILKWDGDNWHDVGGGLTSNLANQIWDMMLWKDELYIVGGFEEVGGVAADGIAKWNGKEWCSLGGDINNGLGAIGVFRDTLYIGGAFSMIDGDTIYSIAKWTGGDHTDSCGVQWVGINNPLEKPQAITAYPNPTTGLFTLNLATRENWTLTLTTIDGRVIQHINAGTTARYQLNLADYDLPPGVYLLHAASEKFTSFTKIVKW